MSRPKILVIDDDRGLCEVLSMALSDHGYEVALAHDGLSGWKRFESSAHDLVLLDVMMPELDGLEVCRRIRKHGDTPVIMLTSRSDDIDMVLGLEIGADDYVAKPFSPRVLVARIRALMRLTSGDLDSSQELYEVGPLRIDRGRRALSYRSQPVVVTATEFDVMWTLVSAPGRVFSRDDLIGAVYGNDVHVVDRTIDTFVKRLRKKLREIDGDFDALETVRSVGYRYRA